MLWYRWTDTLEQLARTVPSQALGQLSARLFIGSYCSAYTALPKSLPLAYKLLEIGLEVAVSEEEKRTTSYFLANMKRLEAVETKLTHLFAKSGREITNLANSGHAIAQYNCAKELLTMARGVQEGDKRETMQLNGTMWMIASAKQAYIPSFFYVGWLHEYGLESIRNLEVAYEWYLLAAAHDDPQAYFRLSQL